ncbi:MAG: hypothetical protein R3230_00680 [Nitrosopumilaceae archaeon]|nr:hypothetical protein [Nitrosopumilaceae archaeon]
MKQQELSNKDIIKMVKRLHHDNERDTIAGIRENCAEFIALHKIHERNRIIYMLLKQAKL